MSLITKAVKKVEKEDTPPMEQEVPPQPKGKKRMGILVGAGLLIVVILSLGYFLFLKPVPEPPRKASRSSVGARMKPVKPETVPPQAKENGLGTPTMAEVQEPASEEVSESPIVPQEQVQEAGIVSKQTDKTTEPENMTPVVTEELQVPQTGAETEIPQSIIDQPAVPRPSQESGEEQKISEEAFSSKGEDEFLPEEVWNENVPLEDEAIIPEEKVLPYTPAPQIKLVEKPLTVKSTSDSKAERYYNKGVSYQKQGEYNQAIDLYNRSLTFNPDHLQARTNLATAYLQTGRFKEAEEQFNFLYFLKPNDHYILYNLGLLLYRTGDLESAEIKLKKLLILDPLHSEANLLLSSVLEEMGDFKEATECCMNAYYIDSANPRVIYRAGRAWDMIGDEKKAIRYYRLFLNTGWENESGLRLAVRERLNYFESKKGGGKMSKTLGDILIETGRLTKSQFELANREKRRTGALFGEICERLGFISHEEVLEFLGKQTETPFLDFSRTQIDNEAVKLIPEEVARSSKLIAVELKDGILTVAMAKPNDINVIDRLQEITSLTIEPRIADEEMILSYIDELYGMPVSPEKVIEESMNQALSLEEVEEETPPLIKLVDSLMAQGIKERATDVHIEVDESVGRVRYRIDGVLETAFILPKKIYRAVVSRIKIMSSLDITESRIPQDGSFRFNFNTQEIDIRVSTMPIVYGESVVMRILQKPRFLMGLSDLGFWGNNLEIFMRLVQKPYGMLVITGPTGSGKSTTLYAALKTVNALEKNVITLEDPVEYQIPVTKQSPIHEKAGYTFAKGLRSILRHDPDIILLGEMRDEETAEMAFRASMTGHLVFTTLHANTASAAVARLLDMKIEPFVISSSLLAVVAQRLARKICPKCKESYTPSQEDLEQYPQLKDLKNPVFYRGRGCERCKHSGYKGRVGLYELLEVNDEVNQLIIKKALSSEIERASKMKSMLEDGLEKVLKGVTTIDEIRRVLG